MLATLGLLRFAGNDAQSQPVTISGGWYKNRRTAAEACGMDRQTLRDWVHRYNAEGLAGL